MIDALDFMELMSLSPRDALVKLITHKNQVKVDPDHMDFGIPRVVSGRETVIQVSGRRPTDGFTGQLYKGTIDFSWKRLDLGVLFDNTKLIIQMDLPCKTSDVIAVLSHEYGWVFDSSDYVNELITADNAHQYELKATPYSLRWVGSVVLKLLRKIDLSDVTPITDFGVIVDTSLQRSYPHHSKHFTDGRYYGRYLKDLPLGVVSEDPILLEVVRRLYYKVGEVDIPWVYSDTPTENNLKNARVLYNGRASDVGAIPYVFTVSRLVILQLDVTMNTNVQGVLVLNYNSQVTEILPEYPSLGYRFPAELIAPIVDGTPELSFFEALYDGTIIHEATTDVGFMDRILNLDPGTVTCTPTPSPYNLYNAQVEYLGRNINYPPCFNPKLTLIWVVRLDPRYCTAIGGRLMIYYKR